VSTSGVCTKTWGPNGAVVGPLGRTGFFGLGCGDGRAVSDQT
jgi:hypothetical protein